MGTTGKRIAVAGGLGVVVVGAALLAKFALDSDDAERADRSGRFAESSRSGTASTRDGGAGPGTSSRARDSDGKRPRLSAKQRTQRVPEWRAALLEAIIAFEAEGDPSAALSRARDIERLARLLGSDMGAELRERLLAVLVAGGDPVALRSIGMAIREGGTHEQTARRLQALFDQFRGDREKLLPISRALAGTGTVEIAGEMLDRLDLNDRVVALEIVRIAGTIRGPEIDKRLVALLQQELPAEVRRAIERSWREAGEKASYEALLEGLDTSQPEAQASYIRILAASKDKSHAARIRRLLDGSTPGPVQVAAVQALASIGDPDSVRYIVEIATTGNTPRVPSPSAPSGRCATRRPSNSPRPAGANSTSRAGPAS